MKRKTISTPPVLSEEIQLENVVGVTVINNASMARSSSGILAYPAGCVIVLLEGGGGGQRHIINKDRKTVTCLAWAAGGNHLVSGESGHKPAVKVWSLQTAESPLVALTGHKFGVGSVAFSPDTKYVISVLFLDLTAGQYRLLSPGRHRARHGGQRLGLEEQCEAGQ